MSLRTLALSLTLVAAAACGGGTAQDTTAPGPTAALQTPAETGLRVGGSALFGATESPLRVTFRRVEADSRCPIDVQCPWAGDAAVELRLEHRGLAAGTTLHTSGEPKEVEFDGYVVRLVNLEPSKRASVEIPESEYVVRLRVSRK